MTLLATRELFIKRSGRYDLVSTTSPTWTDNGANWFIQNASKMLDMMVGISKQIATKYEEVAAGTWYYTFQNCRAIKEVWVNNSESRYQLEKVPMALLKESYNGLISATDQGAPLYYAPAMLRTIDSTDKDSLGSFFNYVLADSDSYNGIVFLPPPDEAYVIEVVGNFYSDSITSDDDENYWTENHEDILLMAALYKLEVFYRNTSGAKDWMTSIQLELQNLEYDWVEEGTQDIDQLGG